MNHNIIWQTSWKEQFADERDDRYSLSDKDLCKYGINCLDKALCGIFKNDLVVIGADSGVGKSEMALNIAKINAQEGKKVVLFYLEGGEAEAMRRMKWSDITEVYYRKYFEEHIEMNYGKWVANIINDPKGILKKIESEVLDKYFDLYKDNLYICPVEKDFGIDQLSFVLDQFKEETKVNNGDYYMGIKADLIIIDHLQYFSLPEKESEITATTKILRECKYITDRMGVPIVLVSHLRKKSRDRGLPSQEDFYGSSNIPKISSTAITISPDYEGEDRSKDRYPTFFRVAKSRTGVRPNIAIRTVFNLKMRKYEKGYQLFKLDQFDKPCSDPINVSDYPVWAK